MLSILFISADPTDITRLRLGEEAREIREKLRLAKFRDGIQLHQLPSSRPTDMTQAILDLEPNIVHFSGHGTTNGEICFENNLGENHPVTPDSLAAMFKQFEKQVTCVILNACYSELQASKIAEHVNFVIGMNKEIGDRAAIMFSIGFYQALGAGRSIEQAYDLGCVQIRLQGIPEHMTPVLIKKNRENVISRVMDEKHFFPGLSSITETEVSDSHRKFVYNILERDEKILGEFFERNPLVRLVRTNGSPASNYLLEYSIDGITGLDMSGSPKINSGHLVEIVIQDKYPFNIPFCQFYTPIFHPNIYELGQVCLGWHKLPYDLSDICIHIGRMIDYQEFDVDGPSNRSAAEWAKTHLEKFPLTNWQPK